MNVSKRIQLAIFSATLLLPACLLAQSGAGTIQGTVQDATAAVIPSAVVQVVNQATGVTVDSTTNSSGFYAVPGLFAGNYKITISAPGMKKYESVVVLQNAQVLVLNPQLTLGDVAEVVNVSGPVMTQSETVTLFNDMCFLAPAALLEAPVRWESLDARRVQATYTNAGNTISAVLSFDESGDLVGFVSEDRYQLDGKTEKRFPWSTPLGHYRGFGSARLASEGEARWVEPGGAWTYAKLVLQRITYNGE